MRKIILLTLALMLTFTFSAMAADEVKTFNDYVMEVVKTYPTDGSEPYAWVNDPGYYGIGRDIYYLGELFIKGDEGKRTYCSGITFEVFMQAYDLYNADHNLQGVGHISNLEQMEDFRRKWYGADGDRRTIKNALEFTGLGYQLTDLSEVKLGDFVQLWRHNGSGHTAIFINWVKDTEDQIIGFNYWSSNYKQGPSYRVEYFGESGKLIKMNETYFMRIIDPLEWAAKNTEKTN